jgi:hypothetical protein
VIFCFTRSTKGTKDCDFSAKQILILGQRARIEYLQKAVEGAACFGAFGASGEISKP